MATEKKTRRKSTHKPGTKIRPNRTAEAGGAWPKWKNEGEFRTHRFHFSCSVVDYSGSTSEQRVAILKDRNFIDNYLGLIERLDPKRVFEIGFFQGGMPLFLADMSNVEKVVSIDWNPPNTHLEKLVKTHSLSNKLKFVGNVDQGDAAKVHAIAQAEFEGKPIDLIIDDCSHYYQQTKGCFEHMFSLLRPGGVYVIEDWGWTHWPTAPWNTAKSHFNGMESMSNLMFEIIMAFASTRGIIASIEFPTWASMVITRGENLPHGAHFSLADHIQVHGGRQARLITEPGALTAEASAVIATPPKALTPKRTSFFSAFRKKSAD